MGRIAYNPELFTRDEFLKAKARIALADKYIGNKEATEQELYIQKALKLGKDNYPYTSDDTIYLALDRNEDPYRLLPTSLLNQAISVRCNFITDTPLERRQCKNNHYSKLVTKLTECGYTELVCSTHSFWSMEKRNQVGKNITITGIDPSLNNWGLVKTTYNTELDSIHVLETDLVSSKGIKKFRVNETDVAKAETIYKHVIPFVADSDMIVIEVPTGSQSSRAMASYGICVGLIGALHSLGIPVVMVTPMMVKRTVAGDTVSKEDVINWATEQHPEMVLPTQTIKGEERIVLSKAEHIADALTAIYASKSLPIFNQTIEEILNENLT